jgi:hypothetical protein
MKTMKKALIAMVCTLGAVACAENRPAEDPSTVTTITTTETTTTGANSARRNPVTTSSTPAPAPRTSPSPADGYDATRPLPGDSSASNGVSGANGSSAPVTAGTPGAVTTDNPGAANGTKDADNTKINDRDRHGALTPMDQGGGNDRDITAAVRRAVVGDKALSFTAKNVKIITVGGKVTLRGPVKSEEEKSSIEAKAKATTGVASVDNQLEVKK